MNSSASGKPKRTIVLARPSEQSGDNVGIPVQADVQRPSGDAGAGASLGGAGISIGAMTGAHHGNPVPAAASPQFLRTVDTGSFKISASGAAAPISVAGQQRGNSAHQMQVAGALISTEQHNRALLADCEHSARQLLELLRISEDRSIRLVSNSDRYATRLRRHERRQEKASRPTKLFHRSPAADIHCAVSTNSLDDLLKTSQQLLDAVGCSASETSVHLATSHVAQCTSYLSRQKTGSKVEWCSISRLVLNSAFAPIKPALISYYSALLQHPEFRCRVRTAVHSSDSEAKRSFSGLLSTALGLVDVVSDVDSLEVVQGVIDVAPEDIGLWSNAIQEILVNTVTLKRKDLTLSQPLTASEAGFVMIVGRLTKSNAVWQTHLINNMDFFTTRLAFSYTQLSVLALDANQPEWAAHPLSCLCDILRHLANSDYVRSDLEQLVAALREDHAYVSALHEALMRFNVPLGELRESISQFALMK